jgi:hypothetical protein
VLPEHAVLPALPDVETAAGAWQTLALGGTPTVQAGPADEAAAAADPYSEPSFAPYLAAGAAPQLPASARAAAMAGSSMASSSSGGAAAGSFWTAQEQAQPQLMHMVPAGTMMAGAVQGVPRSAVEQQLPLEQPTVLPQQQQQPGALPAIREEQSVGSSRRSSRSSLAGTTQTPGDAAASTENSARVAAAGQPVDMTAASSQHAAAAAAVASAEPDPTAEAPVGLEVMGPLPSGVWAWPLCLPVTGNGSSSSSSAASIWLPVSPTGQAPAEFTAAAAGVGLPPVVAVHGLPGTACRIVVTSGRGDVLADCHCELQDGIARWAADIMV